MIAEDHPLAGHGNTGKVAALVSAGFCYKEKFSGRKAAAQVGFQLPAAESDSIFYFIVRICIRPRVEDIFRMIFCERFDKILYGFVYHYFSNLKMIPSINSFSTVNRLFKDHFSIRDRFPFDT